MTTEDLTKGIVGESSEEQITSDEEGRIVEMIGGKMFFSRDYKKGVKILGRELKRLVR